MKRTTLSDLAYEIMQKDKADKLHITYRGIYIMHNSPNEIYWSVTKALVVKHVKYSGHRTYTIEIEINEE